MARTLDYVKRRAFAVVYVAKKGSIEDCANEFDVDKSTIYRWLQQKEVKLAIEREQAKLTLKIQKKYQIDEGYVVNRILYGLNRIKENKKSFDSRGYFTGIALLARIMGIDRQRLEITNNTNINIAKIDYSKLSDEELKQYIDLSNKVIEGTEERLSIDMEQRQDKEIEDAKVIEDIDINVPEFVGAKEAEDYVPEMKWWGSKDA